MGLRGPPATPTNILKARGSWRGKLNPREPRPEPGMPKCPRHLSAAAKKVYRTLCRELDKMGILAKCDGAQLERYAEDLVLWRDCCAWVKKNGVKYPVYAEAPPFYVGKIPTAEKEPEKYL